MSIAAQTSSTSDAMTRNAFDTRTDALFEQLRQQGLWKHLQVLDSPMDAVVKLRQGDGTFRDTLCFCSNNYLGLANHPEVIEAGVKGLREYGAGTASVRFICGTFSPHETLEREIARYMGTEASYTFVSAWTANEAVFPTLCEPGDIIISDELNHACIIDAIRLATVIKKGLHKAVYRNNVMRGERSLHSALEAARANPEVTGQIWVVTDGVFSMEGSIADLPAMRALCDQYGAMLVVDDSHGHGVMGKLGRGTHEHWGMADDLGSPSLREGRFAPDQINAICDGSVRTTRPNGFVARDPYPPGMYGSFSDLIRRDRNLPHLTLPEASYFVTWKTVEGVVLNDAEQRLVLDSLLHFDGDRARTFAACVMNNHVHWLVRPLNGQTLPSLVESVKRFSARSINKDRGAEGRFWSPESFDYIVRDGNDFADVVQYIVKNPVAAGIVARASDYRNVFVSMGAGDQTPLSERGGTQRQTGRVDLFTGTLGKALGGGAGGFVAGSQRAIDLIVQRGRPTLFSNALPVTVAMSAQKAIEITLREPQRVQRLKDNVVYARAKMKDAGFNVLESPTAICPVIVHDTAKAIAMSKRLLELGVFVIGFGYPVVPEGHARLRCQISAAHTTEHIDELVAAMKKL
ncbi:MAG: aminotransferase class I/II-fold pyridoxal phosphate-dependent enzyme [Phycisphaerales bacterium]|nr:aminotransferase class I/II-fold pyridoxal phosphate-dependent enzyme [Phycisphaerales bacterium]